MDARQTSRTAALGSFQCCRWEEPSGFDYAGFAPFGFGYRRCPGEQLTIQVFEDLLRKVWRDKVMFRKLGLANPGQVPIGPNAVIEDDLGSADRGSACDASLVSVAHRIDVR